MFVFSKVHDAQGEKSVKQVLVFTDSIQEQMFNMRYETAVEKQGVNGAHYAGLGAMLMVRAVLNGEGDWEPCIRCGQSGRVIWSGEPEKLSSVALEKAIGKFDHDR